MRKLFFVIIILITIPNIFCQSNRLTNNKGQLLWQYNQTVTIDEKNPNTLLVTFVFINGINQTAISLRQELFNSQMEWLNADTIQIGKEERVEFSTVNLAPNQSVVWKYALTTRLTGNELILERSAVLIMDEDFEVRKEAIPEQRFEARR
ncbi:MAG: hypothetical protein FWD09_05410 [Lentimicrobiaceae bacterium]|nr:hypothetical protein [Lentimicrobiaceae bacterium]